MIDNKTLLEYIYKTFFILPNLEIESIKHYNLVNDKILVSVVIQRIGEIDEEYKHKVTYAISYKNYISYTRKKRLCIIIN